MPLTRPLPRNAVRERWGESASCAGSSEERGLIRSEVLSVAERDEYCRSNRLLHFSQQRGRIDATGECAADPQAVRFGGRR